MKSILIALALVVWVPTVSADYTLAVYDKRTEDRNIILTERFIAVSDCNIRGTKYVLFAAYFGQPAGWICVPSATME